MHKVWFALATILEFTYGLSSMELYLAFFNEYFTTVFSFYLGSPYETNAKRDRGCIIIWEIDVQNWQQETVVVVPRRLSKTENNKKLLTTIYQ